LAKIDISMRLDPEFSTVSPSDDAEIKKVLVHPADRGFMPYWLLLIVIPDHVGETFYNDLLSMFLDQGDQYVVWNFTDHDVASKDFFDAILSHDPDNPECFYWLRPPASLRH